MAVYEVDTIATRITLHKNIGCWDVPRNNSLCRCMKKGDVQWFCENHVSIDEINVSIGHKQWTIVMCTNPHCFGTPPPPKTKDEPGYLTVTGFANKNRQNVLRNTGLPGTQADQTIYVLVCEDCKYIYGSNSAEIWLRKCPNCMDGAPGLPYEKKQ